MLTLTPLSFYDFIFVYHCWFMRVGRPLVAFLNRICPSSASDWALFKDIKITDSNTKLPWNNELKSYRKVKDRHLVHVINLTMAGKVQSEESVQHQRSRTTLKQLKIFVFVIQEDLLGDHLHNSTGFMHSFKICFTLTPEIWLSHSWADTTNSFIYHFIKLCGR